LLIYPAFHPWYFATLLPLLCFVRSRGWILFSLLLPLSYIKYLAPDGRMPPWVTLAQFIPLYLLLVWEHTKSPVALKALRRQAITGFSWASLMGLKKSTSGSRSP
jgi:hypothetical protein